MYLFAPYSILNCQLQNALLFVSAIRSPKNIVTSPLQAQACGLECVCVWLTGRGGMPPYSLLSSLVKGQFRYLAHWAPFLGCLEWLTPKCWLLVLSRVFITGKRGCLRPVVGCSLGSSPTVDTKNRVKRLQPDVNSPPFRFRFWSGFRFNGFTKCQIKHVRNCISVRYLIWNIKEHH